MAQRCLTTLRLLCCTYVRSTQDYSRLLKTFRKIESLQLVALLPFFGLSNWFDSVTRLHVATFN